MIKGLFLAALSGLVLYFAIGIFICWMVSWAGDEKFSLNGVTIKFIFRWPIMFFRRSKI